MLFKWKPKVSSDSKNVLVIGDGTMPLHFRFRCWSMKCSLRDHRVCSTQLPPPLGGNIGGTRITVMTYHIIPRILFPKKNNWKCVDVTYERSTGEIMPSRKRKWKYVLLSVMISKVQPSVRQLKISNLVMISHDWCQHAIPNAWESKEYKSNEMQHFTKKGAFEIVHEWLQSISYGWDYFNRD